jgi:hypothetical protein
MARIAQMSKSGALLCITTGDIGSLLARLRGARWRMIHPPSHLHYFNRATISRLLRNHGFKVVDIRPVGPARSVHQILYSVLGLGMKMPWMYETLKKLIPADWGLTLNTLDIMQVTAEKKGF